MNQLSIRHKNKSSRFVTLPLFLIPLILFQAYGQIENYSSHEASGRSVVVSDASDRKIRITPYGDYMVRIQTVRNNEEFYPDDHYDQVERHDWDGTLQIDSSSSSLNIATTADDGILISITNNRLSFSLKTSGETVLEEKDGTVWSGNTITESFVATSDEHFAGLGHPKYGRIDNLDRKGTSYKVTSGSEGACVVPFYLSSNGYGVFLNTTFTHTVTLCQNNVYSLAINGEGYGGRMDYFFIAGPELPKIVDRYTQLTGRPRMPMKSIFGLHLSDKSDPQNNGEQWWKSTITQHRNAGYAFDHQVNDNAWRQSNEQYSAQNNSWFEWRTKDRYPDPKAYKEWLNNNGITMTLDLNRPGIYMIPSWKSEYGIPGTDNCPDFTNPDAVKWITDLFNNVAFNQTLGAPGDAIWLDEFDYPDHAHSTTLKSGKKWAEESINYHFNLLKACVEDGWDLRFGESKRPYYWVRGITAGGQRYGTYWTGDISGNWQDMAYQIPAMLSAGISGFPYFNHDGGAHHQQTESSDMLFRQWDMGFASFTPIWKPHGPSHNRWPMKQSNQASKNDAMKYCRTRYEMMPYIYSYAHLAARTGMPMARSMFFEDPTNETAWQKDMQYYWGKEMLVAPNCSNGNNNVSVWFPEGDWYDYWNDDKMEGNKTTNYYAATGVVPVFVKAGAIIPKAPYALSTFWIPKDTLNIHVYTGADGTFSLFEDDGVTEKYRTKDEFSTTQLKYNDAHMGLIVSGATGSYSDAPETRAYSIVYHGVAAAPTLYFNGSAITSYQSLSGIPGNETGLVWDSGKKLATVVLPSQNIKEAFIVSSDQNATRLYGNSSESLKKSAITLRSRTLTIHSLVNNGPISVTLFSLNGRTLQKTVVIAPERSNNGHTYRYQYPQCSSGLCIVDIKNSNTHFSKKVLIR